MRLKIHVSRLANTSPSRRLTESTEIQTELYNPQSQAQVSEQTQPLFARATTILFAPKDHKEQTYQGHAQNTNIDPSTHYVDSTPSVRGDVVFLSGPADATCALLGGIMALRMRRNGASGIITHGRVRDLGELRGLGIPVWAKGTSTVGTGEGAKVWARDVEVQVGDVSVRPGDIVCADADEGGVVVIPGELVDQVLELCPRLTAADDRVIEDVGKGGLVQEAFAKHRSNV